MAAPYGAALGIGAEHGDEDRFSSSICGATFGSGAEPQMGTSRANRLPQPQRLSIGEPNDGRPVAAVRSQA